MQPVKEEVSLGAWDSNAEATGRLNGSGLGGEPYVKSRLNLAACMLLESGPKASSSGPGNVTAVPYKPTAFVHAVSLCLAQQCRCKTASLDSTLRLCCSTQAEGLPPNREATLSDHAPALPSW